MSNHTIPSTIEFLSIILYRFCCSVGPDWTSRVRYIPAPSDPDGKPTLPVAVIERNFHFMRSFPQNWQQTTNEWSYFSDQSPSVRSSKRNFFADIHLRSLEDLGDENIHMQQMGHKRKVYNMRNGLTKRSEGDKSYRQVEYAPDFHKLGCTLPAVDFGRMKKHHGAAKTMVLMTDEVVPVIDEKDFELRERQREQAELIHDVIELDNWKPAETITAAFKVFGTDLNDKNPVKYRSRVR